MVVVCSLILACKFYDDRFEKQTVFSKVSYIDDKMKVRLALTDYLNQINFHLVIREEDFYLYLHNLKDKVRSSIQAKGLNMMLAEDYQSEM